MIRVGELVEAVLNEMAIARTKATLFSAQMAADFREHELLRDLPIPLYGIAGAEVSLPFAIARVSADASATGRLPLKAADVTEAVKHVSEALTAEQALTDAFSVYDNQREQWRSDIAPRITDRFAAHATEPLSIDGMSALYGYLSKTDYLLSLIREGRVSAQRLQQSVQARHADLVEEAARRLLKSELERIVDRRGEEARTEDEGRPASAWSEIDPGIWVLVEAKELEGIDRVSTLKVELEEGTLQRVFSEAEEVGRE